MKMKLYYVVEDTSDSHFTDKVVRYCAGPFSDWGEALLKRTPGSREYVVDHEVEVD